MHIYFDANIIRSNLINIHTIFTWINQFYQHMRFANSYILQPKLSSIQSTALHLLCVHKYGPKTCVQHGK